MAFLRTRLWKRPTVTVAKTELVSGRGESGVGEAVYRQNGNSRQQIQRPFPYGKHEDGTCAPCVFFPYGCCTKGDACRYCHDVHKKVTMPARTRKSTRDLLKNQLCGSLADENRHEKWNQSACRHVYARRLISNILDPQQNGALVLSLEL